MSILRNVAGVCAAGLFIAQAAYAAIPSPLALLRPPGAGEPKHFDSRCIRCGRCIEACPYQAISAAPFDTHQAAGTPMITARSQACRLCEDFPCAQSCPTKALEVPESRDKAAMGTAVINEDTCLSFQGMRCEVCYRACPLIDEAIVIDYRQREGDSIHALFTPQVIDDVCPGCGLCEQRCPVEDPAPAIIVVPQGINQETYLAQRNS